MLRIFVQVTLNPGWVRAIFIKFDFKEGKRGGLEASESSSERAETSKARHLPSETGRGAAEGPTESSTLTTC